MGPGSTALIGAVASLQQCFVVQGLSQDWPPPIRSRRPPFRTFPVLTHIVTFDLAVPYSQWLEGFDAHAAKRTEFGITTVFRGKAADADDKVCVILQAEPGVLERFMEASAEAMKDAGHKPETTQVKVYTA